MFVTKIKVARTIVLMVLTCSGVYVSASVPEKDTGNTQTKKPTGGKIDRMFPEGNEHDFGKVTKGTQCKHSFPMVNSTNAPLRIQGLRWS